MAYTTINKSNEYFNTVLNTGDNTSPKSITGVDFQPDFVWTKTRGNTNDHTLFDSVRGAGVAKEISSDSVAGEGGVDTTNYGYLSSFDSDGFTATTGAIGINYYNATGSNYVNWCWKANGTAVSNTDGSITTNVSVNTTAGFSIVTYTGTGSNATIGHGLGVKPDTVFFKRLDTNGGWASYHSVLGATKYLRLDSTSGEQTATDEFQNTEPTSSVISIGTDGAVNGTSMVAYCFADVKGFSKVSGSYVGNGNADGPFIYTGFKPAFVMVKNTNSAKNESWAMWDNKRSSSSGNNVIDKYLIPNTADAETSSTVCDLVSNGFKFRFGPEGRFNQTDTFIYMAFAEAPLVGSNNVPANAR